jgi:hypothetical protein
MLLNILSKYACIVFYIEFFHSKMLKRSVARKEYQRLKTLPRTDGMYVAGLHIVISLFSMIATSCFTFLARYATACIAMSA